MYIKVPKIRRRRKTSDNPEQVYAARGGKMQRIDPELRSSSTPTELRWLSVTETTPSCAYGLHGVITSSRPSVLLHTLKN